MLEFGLFRLEHCGSSENKRPQIWESNSPTLGSGNCRNEGLNTSAFNARRPATDSRSGVGDGEFGAVPIVAVGGNLAVFQRSD
jgi:hypothetical protein